LSLDEKALPYYSTGQTTAEIIFGFLQRHTSDVTAQRYDTRQSVGNAKKITAFL